MGPGRVQGVSCYSMFIVELLYNPQIELSISDEACIVNYFPWDKLEAKATEKGEMSYVKKLFRVPHGCKLPLSASKSD